MADEGRKGKDGPRRIPEEPASGAEVPSQSEAVSARLKPRPFKAEISSPERGGRLVLGIDTCGPSGSVALGRLAPGTVEILEQKELAGRSYSATLVAAVGELLAGAEVRLKDLHAIVVVSGPGSFTGVRVGLSAVKGLAEVNRIPVVAVSRLQVLAWKAGLEWSALDAHRHEVFLRLGGMAGEVREMLAGVEDLSGIRPTPEQIAVCDAAADLLAAAWPTTELVRVAAPLAADALQRCAERVLRGEFEDLALLDGHYLRRSDAEIFGDRAAVRSAGV